MNLFVFDEDPVVSAAGLDDKRIGSALREANQMMSTAVLRAPLRRHGGWAGYAMPPQATSTIQ